MVAEPSLDLEPTVANLVAAARKHGTGIAVLDDSILRFTALTRLLAGLAFHPLQGTWASDGTPTDAEPTIAPVTWAPRHHRDGLADDYALFATVATAVRRAKLRHPTPITLPLALGYDKHSAEHALGIASAFDIAVTILSRDRSDELPPPPTEIADLLATNSVSIQHVETPLLRAVTASPRHATVLVKRIASYELTRAEFLRALDYTMPAVAAELRRLIPTRVA